MKPQRCCVCGAPGSAAQPAPPSTPGSAARPAQQLPTRNDVAAVMASQKLLTTWLLDEHRDPEKASQMEDIIQKNYMERACELEHMALGARAEFEAAQRDLMALSELEECDYSITPGIHCGCFLHRACSTIPGMGDVICRCPHVPRRAEGASSSTDAPAGGSAEQPGPLSQSNVGSAEQPASTTHPVAEPATVDSRGFYVECGFAVLRAHAECIPAKLQDTPLGHKLLQRMMEQEWLPITMKDIPSIWLTAASRTPQGLQHIQQHLDIPRERLCIALALVMPEERCCVIYGDWFHSCPRKEKCDLDIAILIESVATFKEAYGQDMYDRTLLSLAAYGKPEAIMVETFRQSQQH